MTGFRRDGRLRAYSGGSVRDSHTILYSPVRARKDRAGGHWNISGGTDRLESERNIPRHTISLVSEVCQTFFYSKFARIVYRKIVKRFVLEYDIYVSPFFGASASGRLEGADPHGTKPP